MRQRVGRRPRGDQTTRQRRAEWCTYIDAPEAWQAGDEFDGEPDEPPTVGDNVYRCTYEIVRDGATFDGAPWDAPTARDDVFYALPRSRFLLEDRRLPELDDMPVRDFYPRLEAGWGGALRAATGPSRGLAVPPDSSLVRFHDEVRAEIRDGVFALIPEKRTWKYADGRELVTPPGEGPPPEPPTPPAAEPPIVAPQPAPPAEAPPAVAPHPASPAEAPPAVAPQPAPEPSPTLPPDHTAPASNAPDRTPPAAASAALRMRDLGVAGACLVLGLLAGLALRRPR